MDFDLYIEWFEKIDFWFAGQGQGQGEFKFSKYTSAHATGRYTPSTFTKLASNFIHWATSYPHWSKN